MNPVQIYFNLIADKFENNLSKVHEAVKAVYGESHEQSDDEGNDDYLERCIEQDYQDGFNGAAIFQDLFDRTQLFVNGKKVAMDCCVCGNYAGKWIQHSNRDNGYGICVECLADECSRHSPEQIQSLYGYPRLNYDQPLVKHLGLYFRAYTGFSDTEEGNKACEDYLLRNPGKAILEGSKPLSIVVGAYDFGSTTKVLFSDRFLGHTVESA